MVARPAVASNSCGSISMHGKAYSAGVRLTFLAGWVDDLQLK